jgi:predicted lipoprotein with Yx(FWY)xxD motif
MVVSLACAGSVFAASSASTVKAATDGALGVKIVVDSGGFTLYHLTSEKKGAISCTGTCRKFWPPLLVAGSAKPVAGAGVTASKLGTIKRPDGGVQVTYNGYALYRYSADKKPGQANGQGVESTWYAITPAGTVTKATVKKAGATSTSTTTAGSTAPTTTPAAPTTTTPSGNGTTADGCPQGQTIPQGAGAGDGDDDNNGGQSDGDGCL